MEQAWIKEEPLEFVTNKVEIEENEVKMENLDLPGPSSIAIEQRKGCSHPNAIEKCQNCVPIECDLCSITFATRSELEAHDNVFHTHPFHCDICNKGYCFQYQLKLHRKIHFDLKLKCPHCPKNFKTEHSLQCHINNVHTLRQESCKCPLCPRMFARRSQLYIHRRTKHMNIKCELCNQTFDTNFAYLQHVEKKHSNLPKLVNKIKYFTCDQCNKIFDCKRKLSTHKIAVHVKPYKCQVCLKNYGRLESLKSHIKEHKDNSYKFHCNFCEHSFYDKKDIEAHIIVLHLSYGPQHNFLFAYYNNLVCKICHQIFKTTDEIVKHCQKQHENVINICVTCGKQLKFLEAMTKHREKCMLKLEHECDFCGVKMLNKKGIHLHVETNHLLLQYKCKECFMTFCSKAALVIHSKTNHPVTYCIEENQTNPCEYCGQVFKNNVKNKLHVKRSHEKPMVCFVCGLRFGERNMLSLHKLTHNMPTLECKHCDQKFKTKRRFKQHSKFHSLHKWDGGMFHCNLCPKSFKTVSGMGLHKRNSHNILGVSNQKKVSKVNKKTSIICNVCKLSFSTENLLIKHRKNVHLLVE